MLSVGLRSFLEATHVGLGGQGLVSTSKSRVRIAEGSQPI